MELLRWSICYPDFVLYTAKSIISKQRLYFSRAMRLLCLVCLMDCLFLTKAFFQIKYQGCLAFQKARPCLNTEYSHWHACFSIRAGQCFLYDASTISFFCGAKCLFNWFLSLFLNICHYRFHNTFFRVSGSKNLK